MPTIALTGVSKTYGSGPPAVDDLTLTVPDGSFMSLLGPSGCGKTTTLRMIAGLEHPSSGSIAVGERVLDSVEHGVYLPPERRGMGLVFQSYALWPHLTVFRNVEFGLRVRKVPRPQRRQRVEQALAMMQIDWAADRYPSQLSGGQQQRVSLARMLAVEPEVLLLDEPLSNLDARLRLEMRTELKRVHEQTGHTIVFVTHDQLEAMTMATHVAVMSEGVLQQVGAPMEVYSRPANVFVAQFVGSPPMNLFPVEGGDLRGYLERLAPGVAHRVATVGARPEALRLTGGPGDWRLSAEVVAVLPTGSSWIVSVRHDGREAFAVSTEPVLAAPGETVTLRVVPAALHAFDEAGRRIAEWDIAAQAARATVGASQ